MKNFVTLSPARRAGSPPKQLMGEMTTRQAKQRLKTLRKKFSDGDLEDRTELIKMALREAKRYRP